ncbi:hypothetical protein [Solimicrobium silvestre]|uniref:Uncharacterized protein n=1 Tax=Solimicrobium silvestre TaxID=2099400 RepID=A0A2S9GTM1_9BURK|nr:hypothetical protein [Solimicrobium silvestre]PRC91060.1 hypothetical protein S2091_4248 [Solimicrobium silvestre]
MISNNPSSLSISKHNDAIHPSRLFTQREIAVTHAANALPLTIKMSLVDRIKKQLMRGFKKNEITLISPKNYEIQIMPTPKLTSGAPRLVRNDRLFFSVAVISLMNPTISKRYWLANKVPRDKLTNTSSNLG